MEEPAVWVTQSGTSPAIQMVARWTANGDNGQVGDLAQLHVVVELRHPQEEPDKKQKMEEESVWATLPKIVPAMQKLAQWTACGDHGPDGDPAQ